MLNNDLLASGEAQAYFRLANPIGQLFSISLPGTRP